MLTKAAVLAATGILLVTGSGTAFAADSPPSPSPGGATPVPAQVAQCLMDAASGKPVPAECQSVLRSRRAELLQQARPGKPVAVPGSPRFTG